MRRCRGSSSRRRTPSDEGRPWRQPRRSLLVLELGALAIAAHWGYTTGDGVLRWVLAIGAPLLFAAVWGLFVSPKAKVDLPHPARFAVELALLGAAAAALASTGQKTLAIGFAAIAVLSGALNYAATS